MIHTHLHLHTIAPTRAASSQLPASTRAGTGAQMSSAWHADPHFWVEPGAACLNRSWGASDSFGNRG